MSRCADCACELDDPEDECPFCRHSRFVWCNGCAMKADTRNDLPGWRSVTTASGERIALCPGCKEAP